MGTAQELVADLEGGDRVAAGPVSLDFQKIGFEALVGDFEVVVLWEEAI
jgi:hypothetical protein